MPDNITSGMWDEKNPLRLHNNANQPVMLIGCHKTGDVDDDYRHFGGGAYDELAIWTRRLIVNRSIDETHFFTGGHSKCVFL